MKTVTPTQKLSDLYEICSKVFSQKDEPELKAILNHSKIDLNGQVVSAKGITYLHPPLYYATLAMNDGAIELLKASGAKYSRLSLGELRKIKRELSEEIEHLSNPIKAINEFMERDKEIAVHLPDSVRGRIDENTRDKEIQRRKEYITQLDKAIERQKVADMTKTTRKRPLKEPKQIAGNRIKKITL